MMEIFFTDRFTDMSLITRVAEISTNTIIVTRNNVDVLQEKFFFLFIKMIFTNHLATMFLVAHHTEISANPLIVLKQRDHVYIFCKSALYSCPHWNIQVVITRRILCPRVICHGIQSRINILYHIYTMIIVIVCIKFFFSIQSQISHTHSKFRHLKEMFLPKNISFNNQFADKKRSSLMMFMERYCTFVISTSQTTFMSSGHRFVAL